MPGAAPPKFEAGTIIHYRRPVTVGRDTIVGDEEVDVATRALLDHWGRAFAQGETLFREGEAAGEAYLLHQGRVRLLKRVRLVERSLSVLRAGDLFGESALLEGATRTSTAVALSDGIALAVDRVAIRQIAERFPALSERIMIQLVKRVREADDQIEVLMLHDTQSKVVSALLKMARRSDGPAELTISPVDLSSRVGLDIETVKRAVQRLRDQSYVKIVGERVEIPDLEALRRLYALLGSKEELRGER
jgi:CRP/FNR family cyclic AMP-dependent transcriptional regulator